MDSTIIVALIGAAATIMAVILGKVPWDKIWSWTFRKHHNIPNVVGTEWTSTWHDEDNKPYATDRVKFRKWTKGNRFAGTGDITYDEGGNPRRYKYPIEGEVSPQGIVVLTYRAQGYPTQAHIGMACMELSNSARELSGRWAGRGSKTDASGNKYYTVRFGKVKMVKID